MASSDNLASIDPWVMSMSMPMPRLPLPDTWISDTDTFTKAYQKSLSVQPEPFPFSFPSAAAFDLLAPSEAPAPATPTVSGISGSEPGTPAAAPPPKRRASPAAAGKIAKRKSRAAKRTHTTFITADAANFRQMVQQVTGVRFGNGQLPVAPVIKPEPQRPAGYRSQGYPPTLDTSAFLLDPDASQHYHHQLGLVGPKSSSSSAAAAATSLPPPISFPPPMAMDDAAAAFEFDGFCSFPTLESWV